MRPLSFNKIMENPTSVFLVCSWIAADRTASFIFLLVLEHSWSWVEPSFVLLCLFECEDTAVASHVLSAQPCLSRKRSVPQVQHGQEQGGPQLHVSKEFLRLKSMKYRSIYLFSKETKHLHMGKNT